MSDCVPYGRLSFLSSGQPHSCLNVIFGQPHSCLPSHIIPKGVPLWPANFSSVESEPPWRDSNPCLTWAISKGMMLYRLSYWLVVSRGNYQHLCCVVLHYSKHILSCIHLYCWLEQEVMLPNYRAMHMHICSRHIWNFRITFEMLFLL